ncbi:S8 family serine peptidase [Balneolales bacterium ANBcel1]|nr:S8 family serine peptidase [Balneolales bacterium ANBcel1]
MKTIYFWLAAVTIYWFANAHNAHGQTNDPYVMDGSQDYLFEVHNIDQAWNFTTGHSDQRIAIHSLLGASAVHEDMQGRFYANPYHAGLFMPEQDYSTEMAGILGANVDNGIGIAGINWAANMRSYSFLREAASGDDSDFIFSWDNTDYYAGFEEATTMVQQAIDDENDIHLFGFGLPTSRIDDIESLPVLELGIYEMADLPSMDDLFYPELPPTPEERMLDMIRSILSQAFEGLFYSGYTPPAAHVQFRERLIDAYMADQLKVAAAGEIAPGTDQKYYLIPGSMDKSTLTVAGGYMDDSQNFISFNNGHEADYIDVAAYGKNVAATTG